MRLRLSGEWRPHRSNMLLKSVVAYNRLHIFYICTHRNMYVSIHDTRPYVYIRYVKLIYVINNLCGYFFKPVVEKTLYC